MACKIIHCLFLSLLLVVISNGCSIIIDSSEIVGVEPQKDSDSGQENDDIEGGINTIKDAEVPDALSDRGSIPDTSADAYQSDTRDDADQIEINGGVSAIGSLGDPCNQEGLRGCSGYNSDLSLICRNNQWEAAEWCDEGQRCNTTEGENQGKCLPIVHGCEDQQPDEVVCWADAVRTCGVDLVSYQDQPCEENETCSDEDGNGPICICEPGFDRNDSDECVDVCEIDNGGCDPVTECTVTQDGSPSCESCPTGYFGDGQTGCVPVLTGLEVVGWTLNSEFNSDDFSYTVRVPLMTQNVIIRPDAPSEAIIEIDGDEVDVGDGWQSPTLDLGTNTYEIEVGRPDYGSYTYEIEIERGALNSVLQASNVEATDMFGVTAAISRDTIVVGAIGESSDLTGVHYPGPEGTEDNNNAPGSGAVYVFVRDGNSWSQQAYLKASNAEENNGFGTSVAIYEDTLVVGAFGESSNQPGIQHPGPSPGGDNDDAVRSGAAYVFVRDDDIWSQQAYLKASNAEEGDLFGASVSVSGDTVVVGAYQEDSDETVIQHSPGPTPTGDSDDGLRSGAAYIFVRDGDIWSQQAYFKARNAEEYDFFGTSVSISGDTVVIGASSEESSKTEIQHPGPSLAEDDDDASSSGAAYVFVRQGDTWSQQAYLKASNAEQSDNFGSSVSISGDSVVVGAYQEDSNQTEIEHPGPSPATDNEDASRSGAAYVFVRDGNSWSQQAYLKARNAQDEDSFGITVFISGETVLIGAHNEDSDLTGIHLPGPSLDNQNNNILVSGAAYVFTRSDNTWSQLAYLKAGNPVADNKFGIRIAISEDTIIVGETGSVYVY